MYQIQQIQMMQIGDGIYEVEIAYVNTTAGDPNVPIPEAEEFIEVSPNDEKDL